MSIGSTLFHIIVMIFSGVDSCCQVLESEISNTLVFRNVHGGLLSAIKVLRSLNGLNTI